MNITFPPLSRPQPSAEVSHSSYAMTNNQSFKLLVREALVNRTVPEAEIQRAAVAYARIREKTGGQTFKTLSGNTRQYAEMLATLLENHPHDLHEALWSTVPKLLLALPRLGYAVEPNGGFRFRELIDGEKALFWDGKGMEFAEFDAETNRISEFLALAEKISEFLDCQRQRPPLIIDIGAGFGAFALYLLDHLRRTGLTECRFVNVERDTLAVLIGDLLVEKLELRHEITNLNADMKPALEGEEYLWCALNSIAAERGKDCPIIVVTRGALHPYYSDVQYTKMFKAIVQRLHPRAGFHLELVGDRTPTFAAVASHFAEPLFIDPIYRDNPADPFALLKSHADDIGITIYEHIEVWPQFIHDRLFSYLSWTPKEPKAL